MSDDKKPTQRPAVSLTEEQLKQAFDAGKQAAAEFKRMTLPPPKGSIDAAKAYVDRELRLPLAQISDIYARLVMLEKATFHSPTLAARVEAVEEMARTNRGHYEQLQRENDGDEIEALEARVEGLEDRFKAHWEEKRHLDTVQREQGERIAKLEERHESLAVRVAYQDDRVDSLEEDREHRGLASQAGQCPHGWGDGCTDCDDGREPAQHDIYAEVRSLLAKALDALVYKGHGFAPEEWKRACLLSGRYCDPYLSRWEEPAQPIAGTDSDPSLKPGASAGTAKAETEAPIAIERGQVWRWGQGRNFEVIEVVGDSVYLRRRGNNVSPYSWPTSKNSLLACATLVEPAPKTEEPATFPAALSVLRELVAAVKDESVRSNWETRTRLLAALSKAEKLANVPEPPPVEVITGVATWLENCSREVVGVHEDIAVASWLRAVAAAMGGGK
jgi:hypothetical protein